MNVRDITVQFNVITNISDAVGLVLFHCFTKYFVCLLQEGVYGTGYIEHKVYGTGYVEHKVYGTRYVEHKVQLLYVFCTREL